MLLPSGTLERTVILTEPQRPKDLLALPLAATKSVPLALPVPP